LWAQVLGFALLAGGVWGTPNADAYWKATAIVSIWAGSLSHLSWLAILTAEIVSARITAWVAAAAAGGVPLLATIGILAEIRSAPYWWAVALLIIVQLSGGAGVLALNRWGRLIGRLFRRRPSP